jgi:hypothetical protein
MIIGWEYNKNVAGIFVIGCMKNLPCVHDQVLVLGNVKDQIGGERVDA